MARPAPPGSALPGLTPASRWAWIISTVAALGAAVVLAFLLSIAFGLVTVVSVFMVWSVLGAAGVWESINQTVQNILGGDGAGDFDVQNYVGVSRVMGFTLLVAVIDVVLITAIATLGAFLYNMAAALLGGIEVTLTEDR